MVDSVLKRILAVLCWLLLASNTHAEPSVDELQQQMKQLMTQVQLLNQKLHKLQAKQTQQTATAQSADNAATEDTFVDLNPNEQASLDEESESHVLAKPWWQNFEIYGFAAAGFYNTGSAGTKKHGGFGIKESSLFIEADIWEDMAVFLELQANRLGKDDQLYVRTGEVYLHFRDIPLIAQQSFGIKLGRFDIPFGEEYLWQDAIDNPLITNSASYPYGWDEGILLYGDLYGVNWIAAVTDGTDARSIEGNGDKAVNLKFYGSPLDSLYFSASFMRNGDADKSAFEFGGSHFQPIGTSHSSTLGASPNREVNAYLFQLDSKYSFHTESFNSYLSLSLGAAQQDDNNSAFDREIFWFTAEPYLSFNNTWYAVARYSEIGTYDDHQGYHFDGKTFAGGNNAFGYDVRQFRRLGIGLGWIPNPRLRAKLEVGQDWFDLIDSSQLSANNNSRKFVGVEVAVGF